MKLKKIGFQEAVKSLESQYATTEHKSLTEPNSDKSVELDKERNNQTESVLANKPFSGTYEKFYVKSEWLKQRGLSEETLKLYGVGEYRNPSRKSLYTGKVLFPIRRFSDGQKVGYLARTIAEDSTDPKYIFPKGFHKQLEVFGAWQLKQKFGQSTRAGTSSGANASGPTLPLRVGFVVESPLCVMKYWQLGLYAVSPFGAYLSSEQVEIIRQLFHGVVYLPDRDKYPQVGETIFHLAQGLWVKAPALPGGIDDPEKLSPEQIAALAYV